MREICIRSNTSENHKRKNLSIVEVINQNGFVAHAEKKYCYYVAEQNNVFENAKDMQEWFIFQSDHLQKKSRHVSIRKIFDQKTGLGQMVYRVTGSFYVIQNMHVFGVVFMHSIKFDMISSGTSPNPGIA